MVSLFLFLIFVEKVAPSKELSMSIQLVDVYITFDGVIMFVLVFSRRRSTIERAFDEYTTCLVLSSFTIHSYNDHDHDTNNYNNNNDSDKNTNCVFIIHHISLTNIRNLVTTLTFYLLD